MYFQTPETAWLVYTNGLPKCSSSELYAMKENQVLCMIPQVFIYNSEPTKSRYWASLCHVNCPHSLPLLVGAGITGSTAVGTSALIVGNKSFKELSAQVNTDLDHWEKSYILSRALAKVAVQN